MTGYESSASTLIGDSAAVAPHAQVELDRSALPQLFTSRVSQAALVSLVIINAAITAIASLRFGFTQDDLQNTHWALQWGWLHLVGDIFAVWKVAPVNRPTTELCLKLFYNCFGMELDAWRAGYAFLIVLLALSFLALAWRITRNPLAGVIAGLLSAYHVSAPSLYFSTGFIFDMLGVVAVVGFFFLYMAARPRSWKWGLVTVLAFCVVLGTKEIAIDALVFVAMYELVEDPTVFRQPLRWLGRRKRLVALAAIAVAFSLSRAFDPRSLSQVPSYRMTVTWANYWEHVLYWLNQAVAGRAAVWQALLVVTLASLRSVRICVWCIICFLAGILPIAFMRQRELDAAAIPLLALAVLVGTALEALCAIVAAFANKRLGMVLAGAWFAAIMLAQGGTASRGAGWGCQPHDTVIAAAFSALDHLSPPPPHNAHIVVDSDPFGPYPWADLFLFRLHYRNPDLEVKRPDQLLPEQRQAFRWMRIRWVEGRWEWVSELR